MALEVLADLSDPVVMGILLGGLYTLIALGLSLVFGVMRLINVAHGDLVILGTYFGFFAMTGEILGHRLTIFRIDPPLALRMTGRDTKCELCLKQFATGAVPAGPQRRRPEQAALLNWLVSA